MKPNLWDSCKAAPVALTAAVLAGTAGYVTVKEAGAPNAVALAVAACGGVSALKPAFDATAQFVAKLRMDMESAEKKRVSVPGPP